MRSEGHEEEARLGSHCLAEGAVLPQQQSPQCGRSALAGPGFTRAVPPRDQQDDGCPPFCPTLIMSNALDRHDPTAARGGVPPRALVWGCEGKAQTGTTLPKPPSQAHACGFQTDVHTYRSCSQHHQELGEEGRREREKVGPLRLPAQDRAQRNSVSLPPEAHRGVG